ncbi:PREDICTED: protein trichome birefringence-like 2 [Ipomoea nil]|uniref:protein trichome birefringence-like 2 n=1 Tax=Ipomoea nil TaxID=35883 RepID=UPI000902005A|nr:PREDICTED: protein trichome birefringence-like 2 [Ipomoea nil]
MDLKKLAFADQLSQYASTPRKKVVSGCGLGLAAAFIVASVLVLNSSVKTPFLAPVFQGLNSFSHRNSTPLAWSFSFPGVRSCCNNSSSIEGRTGDFGNFSEKVKNNGSFGSGELNVSQIDKSVNFTTVITEGSVLESNVSGSSLETGKNESIPLEGLYGLTDGAPQNSSSDNRGSLFVVENGTNAQNGSELLRKPRGFYGDCDIYDGEWVRDDTKPYYHPGSCPYIDRDFDCHLNKRPDDKYVKWKWQPYACDIPSFNATDFLERLRGRSLVFVGDSLNRNMWEALVCMLRASIRDKKRVFEISGRSEFKKKGFYAFRFEDYNCSVDFVGSPFLVRESSFKGVNGSFDTLRLDLMDPTTSMYNDADVIIFNTGHWWTHEKTSRGEDYYQEGNHVHGRLKVLEAYKRALYTWARWVDKNVDANRTEVIFRGYSATHFRGGQWNSGGQCHKETEPIFNKRHLAKYPSKMKVLEHVLHDMRTPVMYMNISRLTDYRKDAHPSVYRPEGQSGSGVHAQDCSHWCLPGVPDTWNELLYASLLKSGRGPWGN